MDAHKAIEVIKYINFCGLCTTGDCKSCEKKQSKDMAITVLKKQTELSQLIADIKKDFNKDDTYSVSLVLELLESVQIGGSENETN